MMNSIDAMKSLMSINGIGKKVASCILLFGYSRFDVFPVDTWVKKYVSKNYGLKEDVEEIAKFMNDRYGSFSGLVIQYLFNYERNKLN